MTPFALPPPAALFPSGAAPPTDGAPLFCPAAVPPMELVFVESVTAFVALLATRILFKGSQ